MQQDPIQILVSFDQNYIPPFQTMLRSLVLNHPKEQFHIWLLHSGLSSKSLTELKVYCALQNAELTPVEIDSTLFQHAPVTKQYPQEMYYRLLAGQLLPDSLERILYLDPDILVINSIRPLWEIDLNDKAFAAASHSWGPDVINDMNRHRLDTEHDYYNTGVLLMDLGKVRETVRPEEVFAYVEEHGEELLLPDQDVFNSLYGENTVQLDDRLWNYDVRYFHPYRLKSDGLCDSHWIMEHTAILHFCGKRKPWKKGHNTRFGILYQHYMDLTRRQFQAE